MPRPRAAALAATLVLAAALLARRGGDAPVERQEVDVAVVGAGLAGSSAAVAAADALQAVAGRGNQPRVIFVERHDFGGASIRGGAVVYAGGGTRSQEALGVNDSAEEMFNYLRAELDTTIVGDDLLQDFVSSSPETLAWLRDELRVRINVGGEEEALFPYKTAAMPSQYTLYTSGSELSVPFRSLARPAARGHRPLGPAKLDTGGKGHVMMQSALEAIRARESAGLLELREHTRAVRLLMREDTTGGSSVCEGVVLRTLLPAPLAVRTLHLLLAWAGGISFDTGLAPFFHSALERLEQWFGWMYEVRARGGVVLAAGGFGRNREWVQKHLPKPFTSFVPLGSAGEDGAGIQLGLDVGARTKGMHMASGWKFVEPPMAFTKGVLVGAASGRRVSNEDVYGARVVDAVVERADGAAFLILDSALWSEAVGEFTSESFLLQHWIFTPINLLWNRRKAQTLEELASVCGFEDREAFLEQMRVYNESASRGVDDQFGKAGKYVKPFGDGPFYAIAVLGPASWWFTPFITLGGLDVDWRTGRVIGGDGEPIAGLYAAGRNAAGVPAGGYVSGLSTADNIYTGRRCGNEAASTAVAAMEVNRPQSV